MNHIAELQLCSLEEGYFRNGVKSGYCRVMDAENGNVECGFFKNDQPCGKYVKFNKNGDEIEEGIFKGHHKAKDIAIESFTFNVGSF